MNLDPSTRVAHAGSSREAGEPSSPPIHLQSFAVDAGVPDDPFVYGRYGNPTWNALEEALSSLENAQAVTFASGQAASLALLLAMTERSPRVVLPTDGYFGLRTLVDMLAGRGVEPILVDLSDLAALEAELARGPCTVWTESPTNPFLRVFDLAQIGRVARKYDSALVVDNTTATAYLQRPLEFGAAAVLYSLTKGSSGHSDVVLGAVTSRDAAIVDRVRNWRSHAGLIPGPFEAWIALRGLKTLPLRAARQSSTARTIAEHLREHKRVRAVYYPGLDEETSAVAVRQMPGGGGPLLSFEIDGDALAADRVIAKARIIRAGTSFGGVESQWERRARWANENAPESLIRLSVGIEAPNDLIRELDRCLSEDD